MADSLTQIRMDWSNPNKSEAMKLFKQQCEMVFRRQKIKKEDQVDEILLRTGVTGIQKFNSWGLSEADQKNPESVWQKFAEYGETGQQNFRIARLALRTVKQKLVNGETETVEDFMGRCKMQAQLCDFKAEEIEERLIEQLIAGTVHTDVQKELLCQDKDLTLGKAMQIAGKHEASLNHMKQLAETQNTNIPGNSSVNAVQKTRKCQKCGTVHPAKPKSACPAHGSTCFKCQKPNHWTKMCKAKTQGQHEQNEATKARAQQTYKRNDRRHKKFHYVQEDENEGDDEDFEELVFSEVTSSGDRRDEAFAKIATRLPGKENVPTSIIAKVDTGAQGNILPIRVFDAMKISPDKLIDTETVLTAYNGTRIPQRGVIELQCKYKDSGWHSERFYVAETTGPIILGLPSCRKLKLVSLNCAVQSSTPQPSLTADQTQIIRSTKDLVKCYPEQFDRIGHFPGKYHIVLDPYAEPIVHAPRKCPIHLRNELRAEMEKMVQDDIIRKMDEPTAWVSSLTYSRKSNGQLRICLDPKDLNRAIRRCHHKAPTLEELTHSFSGATVFSKLDAKNGYWAVELDEESQLLTTFNSPFGRYCYQRMPFGLVMSQDVYQSRIDQIVEQCPGVVGIADDMVVYGQSEKEHDRNLHKLMKVAKKSGLVFNSRKCEIKQPEIRFFGHVYDENGARPDPKKVEDIRALAIPQNKQQVQEFLGIVTYLAPFIPQLSKKTATIRDLLKKETDFQWNACHQEAFESVKEEISEETTLAYFDPHKTTTIQVDASSRGLGAALMQDGRPIAFASKSLTETEQRYANIEREMLAVVFGCKRFHTYVYASEFIIESDHKPLETINKKNITAAPPRLQRMLLEIQGYDFQIRYKPGKEVMLADGLSRLPNKAKNKEINLDIKIQYVQFTDEKMSELKRESARDPTLAALREIIVEGWPRQRNELPESLRQFWPFRDEMSILDTLVLKGERIFIPRNLRENILNRLHSSHQGVEKTRLRARTSVYWPSIDADIESLIKYCETCQEHQRTQQKETLIQHEVPTRPWEVLGTDLFFFEDENYLIIADYYSKFFFIRKISGQCTSQTVVNTTKQLFGEQGVPAKVISDNGRHFDSECYREFARQWEFKHVTSSPHFPQSNGLIERTIQTVKNTLKKCRDGKADPELALLCVRTTPISNNLPSPAELLYCRRLKANLPVDLHNRNRNRDQVYEQLIKRQEHQKQYHDRAAKDLTPLTQGQPVYVQHHRNNLWEKGTIEKRREEPRSYDVTMPNGRTLRRNRTHLRERATHDGTDSNTSVQQSRAETSNDSVPIMNNSTTVGTATKPLTTRSGRSVKPPTRFGEQ